ncbi:MAG: hypothetical protein A3J28_14040 [Acidobacteria bacterium RIFCSPLOWO2_12_FULL_60_22]|nr:MAG: hypothetical protein A3J28_14040 [Acidobacteria bacterium RIFCSPLOWO2_12_FULL_60_22]
MPENNIIEVNTWEEFEKRLKDLQEMHRQAESSAWSPVSRFLFRGQENSCWPLTTTLERRGREGMLVADYCHLISDVKPEIETFTGLKWDDLPAYPEIKKSLREEYDSFGRLLPYDYMVHLRHHGFPSPLLDWTKSPYIAAFFALRQAPPPRKAYCPEKRV